MRDTDTWMVVFDSTACHFYHYDKHHIDLFKEIKHPENRQMDAEWSVDRPGHYQITHGARGSYAQENNHKKNHIKSFAREINRFLDKERTRHHYRKLILIAEPHMMGEMKKHITKNVERLIDCQIAKDFMHFNDRSLLLQVNHCMKKH